MEFSFFSFSISVQCVSKCVYSLSEYIIMCHAYANIFKLEQIACGLRPWSFSFVLSHAYVCRPRLRCGHNADKCSTVYTHFGICKLRLL
jgi:hypothetical protein